VDQAIGTEDRVYPSADVWALTRALNEAIDVAEAQADEPAGTRSYRCPECSISTQADDAYCRWCGARNPELFEALALAELALVERVSSEARGA
jgi:hypothetical protein